MRTRLTASSLLCCVAIPLAPTVLPSQVVVSRDSAGIRITEASRVGSTARAPRPAARPSLVIGGADAHGPHLLWRVSDAFRSGDGLVFVSVGGDGQVRVFDGRGAHVASYGRRGAGPREFSEFASMLLFPMEDGTVAVEDRSNRRLHVLNASAELVRSVALPSLPGLPGNTPRGRFVDGTWLVVGPADREPTTSGRLGHFELAYHRVTADWTSARELLRLRSRPRWNMDVGGRTVGYRLPFTVDDLAVPAGNDLLVVRSGAAEIRRHDETGALRAIHRWRAPVRSSREHQERMKREMLEGADPSRRPDMARFLDGNAPIPRELPVVQSIRVADGGIIWAERYRLPWETVATWDLLAASGEWLATVELPARFEVLRIGNDHVLGIQRDELDVESVLVLPLVDRDAGAGRSPRARIVRSIADETAGNARQPTRASKISARTR